MKLRELLQQMLRTQKKIGVSKPMICGGTPRDRYLGHLENIADIDITTGDKTVDYLSQEFYTELGKKYNAKRTTASDGHSTIFLGSFKMDFSSNFNVPGIEQHLLKLGIRGPSDMEKEMFSRDFTCNALLLSFDLKTLIDPTHNGFKDIKERTIRTCLDPKTTLTSNKNRVIRALYLACKLDFDIDPAIIAFVKQNPQTVSIATNKVLNEKMNQAFERDPDKASHLLAQMGLWHLVPIPDKVFPYYEKYLQGGAVKQAYFQGGGGVNEPAPGKVKYPAQPAITVQPRFVEPFYRNYDLYYTEGVNGPPQHSPGAGWHHMNKYKSIKEYLAHQRQFLKGKYVADDTWITEDNHQERVNKMSLKSNIKTAYVGRNFDLGTGLYENLDKYKDVESFRKHVFHDRHDVSLLDFPIDDQVTPIIGDSESFETPIKLGPAFDDILNDGIVPGSVGLGDFESYPYSAQLGGLLDKYLAPSDFEGKNPSQENLDYGRDYTDEFDYQGGRPYDEDHGQISPAKLQDLEDKYLNPQPTSGLFGLPDGVDLPDEDLGDPTDIQPYYGTTDVGITMYEDKWNI
jgi:hypothetical protein